jgi:MFS transporter, MHS family, alpha-ketoglutarate permease
MTNAEDAFGTPAELPEGSDRLTEDELIEAIPHRPINMAAGTIGHFVEWYDWYIYGLLAAVFAEQIFPSDSPFASLIAALLTYAIGFVIRPFSGIIISPPVRLRL